MYLKQKIDLYLTDSTKVSVNSQNNLVLTKKEKRQTIPPEKINSIVCIKSNEHLDYKLLKICKKYEINLTFLTGQGKIVADIHFGFAKNVFVRLQQIRKHLDENIRLKIGKQFLKGKIQNSMNLGKTFDKKAAIKSPEIETCNNYDSLRGIEGSLAKQYFSKYKLAIKNKDLPFIKRSKNPPQNEVNALLSFLYTIVNIDISNMIEQCGLDPYVGFFHYEYYGRPSLACDFLEEFRAPFIDKFVATVINRQEFKKEDFRKVEVEGKKCGVFLKKSSMGKLFAKWADWYKEEEFFSKRWQENVTRRRLVEKQIRHFIHFLIGDEPIYLPFDSKKP